MYLNESIELFIIGEVISTKRNELNNILRAMNIQIDNPISILNQDISRTFLVSSKPEEKYELFMKATLLDIIGINYKEAKLICEQEYQKLRQYNEVCICYLLGIKAILMCSQTSITRKFSLYCFTVNISTTRNIKIH